jgi:hypothetical protein
MKQSYIIIFFLTEHMQLKMICARVGNEVRSGFVCYHGQIWMVLLQGTHPLSESHSSFIALRATNSSPMST